MIFLEPLLRIADRPDYMLAEISEPTDVIHHLRFQLIRGLCQRRIQHQGIDREIAPEHVLFRIAFKADFQRMPAVGIRVIATKCGNFNPFHQNHPKLCAHQLGLRKYLD